jgi:hypothetical protein
MTHFDSQNQIPRRSSAWTARAVGLPTIRVGRCRLITRRLCVSGSSERLKRRLELRVSGLRAYCSFLNIRRNRTRRKSHDVKTCAARSGNNGVGIAVKPLFLVKVRGRRIYPNKRVLVTGNALEFIRLQLFVASKDGLAVHVRGDDTTVGSRSLAALGRLFLPKGRSIRD